MTDLLANYDNDALLSAVCDVITAMPDEPRQRAAAALDERRIGVALYNEPGLDDTPMRVIEITIVDQDGAWPIARFDANRFGL